MAKRSAWAWTRSIRSGAAIFTHRVTPGSSKGSSFGYLLMDLSNRFRCERPEESTRTTNCTNEPYHNAFSIAMRLSRCSLVRYGIDPYGFPRSLVQKWRIDTVQSTHQTLEHAG